MMFYRKLLALVLVGSMSLLLNGCTVRLAYNQLDWLVPWYLEDYFEPEGEQVPVFDQRLKAFLAWHRSQQLPQYADFLDQVASWAELGLQPENIEYVQERTAELGQALVQRITPDMMALLALSTEQQVEDLFAQLELDNQDFREDYVDASPDQQRNDRRKAVLRYVQRWTGKLNSQQRELIEDWSRQYELMGLELEQSRLAWQVEFARVLQLRDDAAAYQTAFTQLSSDPEFGQSDVLKSKLERNGDLLLTLYHQLDHSLTDKQRQKMVSKLRRYARDFRILSGQKI